MFYRSGRKKTHLVTQIPVLATLHHCHPTSQHQSRISLDQIRFLKKNYGYVIAIQIFSRNRRNTILIGSITQDVEKGNLDKFLRLGGGCLITHTSSCYLWVHEIIPGSISFQ